MEGLDWSSQPFQCGRMCEVGLSGLLQWEEKSCLHFLSRAVQIINSFLLFVCFNSRNENSEGKKKSVWIQLNLGLSSPDSKQTLLSEELCQSILFPSNVSTCSTCEESHGNRSLSSYDTTVKGKSVILLCRRSPTWGVPWGWNNLLQCPLLAWGSLNLSRCPPRSSA